MLRKISSVLFAQQNQIKRELIKTGITQIHTSNSAQIEKAALTHQISLQDLWPTHTNDMFKQTNTLSVEKSRILHELIQQTKDFNFLTASLSKAQKSMVIETISRDMTSLQKLLAPLSGNNQLQVMDFIGLDRLRVLCKKGSKVSRQSTEMAFFLTSESLNAVLKRENHNYLYKMREREQTMIAAARPASIKNSLLCP